MWKLAENGKYKNIEDSVRIMDPKFIVLEGNQVVQVVSFKESIKKDDGNLKSRVVNNIYIFDKGENLCAQLKHNLEIDGVKCIPIVKENGNILSIGYFSTKLIKIADGNVLDVDYDFFIKAWWRNVDRSFDFSRIKQEFYKMEAIDEDANHLKITKLSIPTHSVRSINELKYKGKLFGYKVYCELNLQFEFIEGCLVYDTDFNLIGSIGDDFMKRVLEITPNYVELSKKSGINIKKRQKQKFNDICDSYTVDLYNIAEDMGTSLGLTDENNELFDFCNNTINKIAMSVATHIVYDGDKPIFAIGDAVGKIIEFKCDSDNNVTIEAHDFRFDESNESVINPFRELADQNNEIVVTVYGMNSEKIITEFNSQNTSIEVYYPGERGYTHRKFTKDFENLWNIEIGNICRLNPDQKLEDNQVPTISEIRTQLLKKASEIINSRNTFGKPVKLLYADGTYATYKDSDCYENLVAKELPNQKNITDIRNKIDKTIKRKFTKFVDELEYTVKEAIDKHKA